MGYTTACTCTHTHTHGPHRGACVLSARTRGRACPPGGGARARLYPGARTHHMHCAAQRSVARHDYKRVLPLSSLVNPSRCSSILPRDRGGEAAAAGRPGQGRFAARRPRPAPRPAIDFACHIAVHHTDDERRGAGGNRACAAGRFGQFCRSCCQHVSSFERSSPWLAGSCGLAKGCTTLLLAQLS